MSIANIDALVGRHFVSSSGNAARIIKIAPGALRFIFKTKPSRQDMDEGNQFVLGIIGDAEVTEYTEGIAAEAEALALWQRRPQ